MPNFKDEPDVKDQLVLAGIVLFTALGGAVGSVLVPWLFMTYFAEHFFHGSRYIQAYHSFANKGMLAQALSGLMCIGFPGMLALGIVWTTGAKVEFRAIDMIGVFPGALLGGMILAGVLTTLFLILMSGVA